MTPRKRLFDFSDARLYVLTAPLPAGRTTADQVRAALEGGADVIQLREKTLPARPLIQLCRELKALCDGFGALFIVNDRVDVALAADADGVHLGQDDLPAKEARRMLGHRKIIGVSTHSTAQALIAQADGADYVGCGPVFGTPTKPDYAPVGLDLVKEYRRLVRIPFVAIGGIDASNIGAVVHAGARTVAVVRAVCGAPDPRAAAQALRAEIVAAEKVKAVILSGR
jgi:thiamine-phosphate pyrophosphorylase